MLSYCDRYLAALLSSPGNQYEYSLIRIPIVLFCYSTILDSLVYFSQINPRFSSIFESRLLISYPIMSFAILGLPYSWGGVPTLGALTKTNCRSGDIKLVS